MTSYFVTFRQILIKKYKKLLKYLTVICKIVLYKSPATTKICNLSCFKGQNLFMLVDKTV